MIQGQLPRVQGAPVAVSTWIGICPEESAGGHIERKEMYSVVISFGPIEAPTTGNAGMCRHTKVKTSSGEVYRVRKNESSVLRNLSVQTLCSVRTPLWWLQREEEN